MKEQIIEFLNKPGKLWVKRFPIKDTPSYLCEPCKALYIDAVNNSKTEGVSFLFWGLLFCVTSIIARLV